ncbi:MAG: hypothetical protein ACLFUZ_00095 [Candidatus Micrarchaeia archaeon]
MISVDEEDFLIATDIDKLIDILSTRKDVEVGKLSKELKMNRREVEKWLHVLEDEGVVNLDNRMGALHALWVMEEEEYAPPSARSRKKPPAKYEELELQETTEEPVDLVEEIGEMAPLRSRKKSFFPDVLKGSKKKPKKEKPKIKLEEEPPREPPKKKPAKAPSAKTVEKPPVTIHKGPAEPMKQRLEKSKFLNLPSRKTGKLREQLDEYLKLIKEGKEELKQLESEKERVHREGFLSLEKEFEASLDNLEYALLEKEKRILEAKERVSTLPEKVEEIEQMQEALRKFDKEAGNVLSRTKKGLDKDWGNLQEVSGELSEEISKGEEEVMRDRSRIMQLRDMLQSMEHAESQLRETLESGRNAIEEMEEKVRTVEESLEDIVDSRAIVSERIEHIHSTLERRMKSIENLREELEKVEKVEHWFREYSDDYQEKMDEMQEYVQQSEDELERIRKAAELEYVNKYLQELDVAEDKYRDNLGALEMEEASIDEQISDVRGRIKQLMRESSEIMSKYRHMADEGGDFQEMVATARERNRQQRTSVDEKASQRRTIVSESKKAAKRSRKPQAKPKKQRTKNLSSKKKPKSRKKKK